MVKQFCERITHDVVSKRHFATQKFDRNMHMVSNSSNNGPNLIGDRLFIH